MQVLKYLIFSKDFILLSILQVVENFNKCDPFS
jgi:hypothetical protein